MAGRVDRGGCVGKGQSARFPGIEAAVLNGRSGADAPLLPAASARRKDPSGGRTWISQTLAPSD